MHLENSVLKRWDRWQTSVKIGAELNMRPAYVRVIVQRARARGDQRAHERKQGRLKGIPVQLTTDILTVLATEADRRDMTERELATTIISTALRANLVAAILDDGESE